jgi:two-component system sensor histidine kinase KdpD
MEPGTPDEGARGRARAAAPARRSGWGRPTDYLWSALAVAGITLLGTSIYTLGHITNIGLLYLIPVMFAATRYGLRAGIVTGLLSSLCYNFFFLHPAYSLTIHAQNLITLLVLIGVAVVASQLAERVRTQAELARSSASQNSALAGFARSLTGATTGVALGQTLCGEAARLFGVDAVLLLPANGELKVAAAVPPEDRLGAIEQAAVAWAFEHGQPAGLGSDTLTASDWLFQPLRAGGKTLGVLGLARPEGGNAVRSDELPLLLSLIDQAALALERILLEDEMATVAQLKERDRVRAALLSSVSRDVKAPLATMLSAIAELRREGVDAARLDPLQAMAERLNRFAANLVDLSRIEAGSLALAPEPVDLAEAAAEAAHELRHALKGHAIQLDVSPELPPVRVDPELLRRCLVNLLELAGKYAEAETPIAIAAVRKADGLKLSIMDEGPGLPAYGEGRSLEADGKSGAGLGLAITRSLARALGLSVTVGPRAEPAGAVFTLRFPDSVLVKKGAEPA